MIKGSIVAIVTPMHEDGSLDLDSYRRLIDWHVDEGTSAIVAVGTTGESPTVDFAEHCDLVRVAIEQAAGRVPVIAGVASTTIVDAVSQAREFEQLGCNGILAILESYFPISDEGVFAYFRAMAEAVSVPLVLYTNPNFQRSDLSLPVIDRLSRIPNVGYIKDASSNTGRLLSIINRMGERMKVFSASAHIPACVMLIGGVGWMAGPACLAPRQSVELYELCCRGSWDAAMNLQRRLWTLNQAFAKYNIAACIKGGLELQGYAVGAPLLPQAPLPPDGITEVRRALEAIEAL